MLLAVCSMGDTWLGGPLMEQLQHIFEQIAKRTWTISDVWGMLERYDQQGDHSVRI